MLNDKSRHGLSHLPARRKWASLHAGITFRFPEGRICGGWASGPCDFYPVRIESVSLDGESVTIRGLSDSRKVKVLPRRVVENLVEHSPFGRVERSRPVSFELKWWQRSNRVIIRGKTGRKVRRYKQREHKPRYV
jgi:hypothetical protein